MTLDGGLPEDRRAGVTDLRSFVAWLPCGWISRCSRGLFAEVAISWFGAWAMARGRGESKRCKGCRHKPAEVILCHLCRRNHGTRCCWNWQFGCCQACGSWHGRRFFAWGMRSCHRCGGLLRSCIWCGWCWRVLGSSCCWSYGRGCCCVCELVLDSGVLAEDTDGLSER